MLTNPPPVPFAEEIAREIVETLDNVCGIIGPDPYYREVADVVLPILILWSRQIALAAKVEVLEVADLWLGRAAKKIAETEITGVHLNERRLGVAILFLCQQRDEALAALRAEQEKENG